MKNASTRGKKKTENVLLLAPSAGGQGTGVADLSLTEYFLTGPQSSL